MFREMRRNGQRLTPEECGAVLERGTSGVLSLLGDGGYPYGVPMSYVFRDGIFYFHSAVAGHKLDAVRRESRASFCVIDQDQVLPEKYTTVYRSVIAFGRAEVVDGPEEKLAAVLLLADKYSPDQPAEDTRKEIDGAFARMAVLKLTAEHITGKEGIELTRQRNRE